MSIEERIAEIEQRNDRVSTDKEWETSLSRRSIIAMVTYFCASIIFLYIVPHKQWYLASLVPT